MKKIGCSLLGLFPCLAFASGLPSWAGYVFLSVYVGIFLVLTLAAAYALEQRITLKSFSYGAASCIATAAILFAISCITPLIINHAFVWTAVITNFFIVIILKKWKFSARH